MFFSKNKTRDVLVQGFTSKENINENIVFEEMYINGDSEVQSIMYENYTAVYYALVDDNPKILQEGFGDFVSKVMNFFKKLAESFIKFVKNLFALLESYFTDFKKFTDKYKDNATNIKPFEISMFKYTIKNGEVDNCGLTNIINSYNNEVNKIKSMSKADVQDIISKESSKDNMSSIRGKICGLSGSVNKDRYHDELAKSFRDGKTSPTITEVDSAKIHAFISDYKELEEICKSTKNEQKDVEGMFHDIIDFFKGMPTYKYESSDNKSIDIYKIKNGDKNVSFDKEGKESHDTEYYKRLTAYYSFRFKHAKDISYIYSKAYTMKVSAIKEAMGAYRSVIRKALNPFNSKEEVNNNA